MTGGEGAAANGRGPVRERVLDAAAELTSGPGWSTITMAKLADAAGVSRQTVYNEVGSKTGLAEALIMRELARFLAVVEEQLTAGDDVVDAIRRTARAVLELARENRLLHAVLSASHGAGNDLLPLLTSHSASLIEAATVVVRARLVRFDLDLDEHELEMAIDVVVRLVLSHVMQPGGTPESTAEAIAWIVGRTLA
ncbi:MAG: TetR family transcriptional regulator [Nocardioides sp.]|nr:TetR family transcriptional regulator [Nocardioides sp.]